MKNLLKKAKENGELLKIAKRRTASWDEKKALPHKDFWAAKPRRRKKH